MATTACTAGSGPAFLAEAANCVEKYLSDFLDARPLPENLREGVKYALLGGGKRLRPALVLRCCAAVGGRPAAALPPAAAIELIHTFSLVHDDLPAMDNDDLRRGRPTLHRHANQALAILAGDLMNTLAFELIATRVADPSLASALTGELASATDDMIAGQVYDTLGGFDDALSPLQRLQTIHRHKTAALIRCACRMGGLCGGANATQLDALSAYGDAIGLMFQVVDDLLDVTQTTEQLGKTAGKDSTQGKLTYPSLLGLQATRDEISRLRQLAHHALSALQSAGGHLPTLAELDALCHYMAHRSN